MTTKKRTPQPPKVWFDDRQFILQDKAGATVKLFDGANHINVLAAKVKPINNAARQMLKK